MLLKMKPLKLEIIPFGFSVTFKSKIYNKKILKGSLLDVKKIIVAACGPLMNLLIIFFSIFSKYEYLKKDIIIFSNLLILMFNLLPIYPLDGGRIIKSIIHIFLGRKTAIIVTNKIENCLIIIITIIGSIAIFYFENISIFLIIIYLWLLVIQENKRYKIIKNAYT
ncbi:MAG: site-2 protease family protein [Clostridia bacterium]|nr:site-2 protease family protein [Clostridia bacterium]